MSTQIQSKHVSMRGVLAYLLAAAFLCYEMALQVSPSVMTADLMRALHIDALGIGFIASVYFYPYTIMQIPVGLLFDRFSTRKLITFAIFVCALGAWIFGMADTLSYASIGRFFMGIGSSFAFITVLVVATRYFPGKYFALLVGIAQCLAAVGAMMGELPVAIAVEHSSWREVINIIAISGFVLMILSWLIIRDSSEEQQLHHQQSGPSVLGSLRMVTSQAQTWWLALYAFACWAPITAFPSTWGVSYLAQRYEITNSKAAGAVSMIWIGLAIASPIVGWLSDFIGRRNIIMQLCGVIGLGCSLAVLYLPHVPLGVVYVLLFGFGVATAGQIISFASVRENNQPKVTATAIGFNNMAVVAGGAIFPYLVGSILRGHWQGAMHNSAPLYSVSDFQMALMVVPICFFLTAFSSLFFIRETYCQSISMPPQDARL